MRDFGRFRVRATRGFESSRWMRDSRIKKYGMGRWVLIRLCCFLRERRNADAFVVCEDR